MFFDIRTQALLNFAIQALLIITVFVAVFLAKKGNLGKHCIVMRVSVLLQIIAIAVVMLPSMFGYIENVQRDILFNIEILVHHTLGLIVIAIWIYINLVFSGVIRIRGRLAPAMKLALAAWILALIIGLHMYLLIWM